MPSLELDVRWTNKDSNMNNFRSIIFSLATITFSAAIHAMPMQYQITAFHTSEVSLPPLPNAQTIPVSSTDYFFADGTPITATFFYDSEVLATAKNIPVTTYGTSGTYTSPASLYSNAFSNLSIEVAGHSIYASSGNALVINSDNTSALSPDGIAWISNGAADSFNQLSFGDYIASYANLAISGYTNMLSDQSLPTTLIGLDSIYTGLSITFRSGNDTRSVRFSDGAIAQVPGPSAALCLMSGLVGLFGANIFKKTKR